MMILIIDYDYDNDNDNHNQFVTSRTPSRGNDDVLFCSELWYLCDNDNDND